jgi:acyl-CoA synthetase (NDP forming)
MGTARALVALSGSCLCANVSQSSPVAILKQFWDTEVHTLRAIAASRNVAVLVLLNPCCRAALVLLEDVNHNCRNS